LTPKPTPTASSTTVISVLFHDDSLGCRTNSSSSAAAGFAALGGGALGLDGGGGDHLDPAHHFL